MIYQIEYPQDPNCLIIHLDEVVSENTPEIYEKGERREEYCPVLAQEILSINGIKTVDFEPYSIMMEKGQVFEWDKILDPIMLVLAMNFDEIKEKAPPLHSTMKQSSEEYAEVDSDFDEYDEEAS